jgi:hypothetical protein
MIADPFYPQQPGYTDDKGQFHVVPEMIPEFVVPDLKDFKVREIFCSMFYL